MGGHRGESLPSVECYAIASSGGSTAGLDQELSRFRRRVPDAELFRITMEPATDATVADEDKWLTEMH